VKRLFRQLALVVLAGSTAAGCALSMPGAGAAGAAPIVLAPEAFQPPSALPALVNRGLGIEWHTCSDLLQALRDDKVPEEVVEQQPFNAYEDCLPPALLAQGRAPGSAGPGAKDAGERLYRDLDLSTVPSALAPRRPAEHYRLSDFSFASVKVEPLSVSVRDDAFSHELRVLAVGDFRRSGRSELLVRFTERALNGGSYDRTSVLVVDGAPDGTTWTATDALAVLRAPSSRDPETMH